jgi:hypothetical protein
MEINDYSTRLAQARNKYNDSTVELRDTYNKDVDRLQDLHEAKEKKQAQNYTNSKNKLEQQQADYINEYNAKTSEAIEDRTSAFRKDLERERFSFNEDRNRIKEDFNRRLGELSDTYRVRENESNAYNEQRLKTTKDRYDKQVTRLNDQFQEDIDQVAYRADKSLKANTAQANREKRAIVSANELEKRELIKNSNVAKTQMVDNHSKDIQNLRDTQAESVAQLKDYHEESADDLRKIKNNEQDVLQDNFRKLTDEISSRNQRKRKFEVKENELRAKNLEKQYADNMYQARREMNEKLKGGDRSDIVQKKLDHTVSSYEDRIKTIYDKVEDDNFNQQIDKERMADSFSATIKDLKFKGQQNLEEKDKVFREFRTNELAKVKDKSDIATAAFQKEVANTEMRAEAQSLKDRAFNKKLITNQRKVFGETVNTLNEKNREALTQLQAEHSKEKTNFIEAARRQHHNELEETKYDMKRIMAQKEQSLMERNEQLIKNNEKTIALYESKLDRIEKKSHKELEKLKQMHAEQNDANKIAVKRLLDAKDREAEFEKVQIKTGYDKRLSRAKDMADKQIEKTVAHYEDLLTREREDSAKKFQTKVGNMQADYEKLYQQNELEKATMQQQFQDRIEELRMANSKALEEKSESYKNRNA